MNMKCAICGSDKFHLDIENQILSCSACSFYCDFKALVRGSAAPHAQAQPQRPAYNPADFEIVGGVLKKYKGAAVDVVVPDGVLEIARNAFADLKHISSIKLPDGLKVIGEHAFWGCSSLRRINIPNSVVEIRTSNVDIGRGSNTHYVKRNECFAGCKNLVDITFPNDRFSYLSFEGTGYYEQKRAESRKRIDNALQNGVCPRCNSKLGMFKRCNTCKFNWK